MLSFGTRKIQQLNKYYYVNLPVEWVRNNTKGKLDRVTVILNDQNQLVITSQKGETKC